MCTVYTCIYSVYVQVRIHMMPVALCNNIRNYNTTLKFMMCMTCMLINHVLCVRSALVNVSVLTVGSRYKTALFQALGFSDRTITLHK